MGIEVIYHTGGAHAYFDRIAKKATDQLMARAVEAMEVVIQAAVLNAKEFTASRPSAKSGKAGRVDTNDMIDAIKGDIKAGADEVLGRFGFIEAQELYFKLQTVTGFMHGDFIEPTNALRDAKDIAISDLHAAIRAAVKDALS